MTKAGQLVVGESQKEAFRQKILTSSLEKEATVFQVGYIQCYRMDFTGSLARKAFVFIIWNVGVTPFSPNKEIWRC